MTKKDCDKQFTCDYDEKGTEEVTAQVMDAYNDGAIDSILLKNKKNEPENEK
jgi:hypothetical protein